MVFLGHLSPLPTHSPPHIESGLFKISILLVSTSFKSPLIAFPIEFGITSKFSTRDYQALYYRLLPIPPVASPPTLHVALVPAIHAVSPSVSLASQILPCLDSSPAPKLSFHLHIDGFFLSFRS